MTLMTPDELRSRLLDPDLRICDVRWWLADPGKGRRDYEAAHIPGAIFVDLDRDLVAATGPGRHPLPSPSRLPRGWRSWGSGTGTRWWPTTTRVGRSPHACGGCWTTWGTALPASWTEGSRPGWPPVATLTAEVPELGQATLTVPAAWTRVIGRERLAERLVAGDIALVDARARERYRGDVEPIDPVAGHIPGAVSRPTSGNLTTDGSFLAADALRARFVDLGSVVANQCGSGVNACHNALAMRIAGLPDPLLYPGSYSDWSTAGLPVATGDEPGRYRPVEG